MHFSSYPRMKTLLAFILVALLLSSFAQEEDSVVFIEVPNIFTPGCCQIPCEWNVHISPELKVSDYKLTVFNRWGEIVYESTDPEKGWDGKYSRTGNFVEEGIYIWQLEFTSLEDLNSDGVFEVEDDQKRRGHVTILR